MSQEKAIAAEKIEEIKREHESNMNETTARHEAELQVTFCSSFALCIENIFGRK